MAEDTVVKEQLTDAMIEAGAALTAKLDEIGAPPHAVFWNWEADNNEWKLVCAFSEVANKGSMTPYSRIQQARGELDPQAADALFLAIRVVDADHPLVRWLRSVIHRPSGIARIRFSKNTIDGHYIDDTLIYRMG